MRARRDSTTDQSIVVFADGRVPAYTPKQYDALRAIVADVQSRHPIRFMVGHDEIAPGRKTDPGELFNWSRVRNPDLSPL